MIPPNEARQFAATAHEGQVDKNGRDYFEHLREVAEYVEEAGGTDEEIAAAWLHDIVEDTETNFILLEGIGLSRRQLAIIWAVTKQEGESYPDYLHRLRGTPGATELKLADIKSNTRPERLATLSKADRERLTAKYANAVAILTGQE